MHVWDLEANGLHPTKIHCLSVQEVGGELKSTPSYANMRKFFSKAKVLIGHNITRWDVPNVERLLGIKIEAKIVDTLALSWYLQPDRVRHGLEGYGEDFGIPKPPVYDWENEDLSIYIKRCEEDVKINTTLWNRQWKQLLKLYGSEEAAWKFIDYISFKMDCAREQEARKWKLDVPRCTRVLEELLALRENKVSELKTVMPKVAVKAKKTKPKKPYKQDGSFSLVGGKWHELLLENNLDADFDGVIEVVTGYKEPNPGSTPQIKAWLSMFNWIPETFEYKRNKETGDVRKIPQINLKFGAGVCPSIKKLFGVEPKLQVLEGLSVLTHRISILKGFLENIDENGYIQAQIQGITNTLRVKHKVCVNLPGVDKPYGEDIRGCLIAPDGYELLGSDMSSLEDRTKQHYMWKFDPDYVKEMMTDDFDPHLNLAEFAGALSPQQVEAHKSGEEDHGAIRKVYKAVNYASVYGAGGATVARAAGVTKGRGESLVESYWKRNWSVKAIAEDQITKTCNGRMWLYNPVSGFWYSLRHKKDIFSTLNQGTGVYCFDTWVKHLRSKGLPMTAQFHDEVVSTIKEGQRDRATAVCKWAIKQTNEELELNRDLDCSIDFGGGYDKIH